MSIRSKYALALAASAASLALATPASALPCATSDVSLTIDGTLYTPNACADSIAQGGGPTTETNALQGGFGLSGFSYLDKSDDAGTPTGLGGITFQVSASGGNSGTWSVTWTDAAGLPNLPAHVSFLVGLFGGNNGSGYHFTDVLLPLSPNTGTGTFDINFLNNGGQQPALSHLLLAGKFLRDGEPDPDPEEVPEPAALALLGLGITGIAFARRRRIS